jgi:hypothetical protein
VMSGSTVLASGEATGEGKYGCTNLTTTVAMDGLGRA